MTVTELMNKLIELTADGKGDLQVADDDFNPITEVDVVDFSPQPKVVLLSSY